MEFRVLDLGHREQWKWARSILLFGAGVVTGWLMAAAVHEESPDLEGIPPLVPEGEEES